MNSQISRLQNAILNFRHGRLLFITSSIFALIYHLSFLIVFKCLSVMPMFYFNIVSVILFAFVTLRSFKMKNVVPYYFVCYIEVVVHQIMADFFLGGDADFHYFILLIGLLPALVFGKRIKLATFVVTISVLIFMLMEGHAPFIFPVYIISYKIISVIRIVNISCTSVVIASSLLLYAYIVLHVENNLEEQVNQKAQKIVSLQNHTIESLANLVENRDIDTGDHIQRTSAYVNILATEAFYKGLYPSVIDRKFIDLVTRVAPLHDIGKIIISDTILKKPGKLTDDEFNTMKTHTTEGVRIVKEIFSYTEDREYVSTAMDVAGCHHERWNGLGYPKHLKGEEIPVSARIMAIADVFDALVSVRCYKAALPLDEAFEILQNEAGNHFDPALIDVFISVKDKVIEAYNQEEKKI